jgi:glycerol-3-phosphate dehydrogenase subunit C
VERKILYYHGCVVDYFDHKTGQAVVEILERIGCTVEVPELICCSFPLLNAGEFQLAQKRAAELTRVLAEFVEAGYEIVYSCPTCGHALKETYPKLLDSDTARAVAESTHFISSYILDLLGDDKRVLSFRDKPAQIAYHTPCHLRSQDLSSMSVDLLNLVPGAEVEYVNRGCCGMGGSWALRYHRRGEISAEVGGELFNEIREEKSQLVATDCFSCGIQIARYTKEVPVHPLHIILDSLNH